jgi:hypothetical protein
MFTTLTRAIVVALLAVTSVSAQDKKPAGSLTDVTGVWVMQVASHQLGLELEQKGTVVEGVMLAMGQRILLVGEYVDLTLTLKGEKPEDGAPAPHVGGPGSGPITAKMLDDGTLEGDLSTTQGRTKWTGERLQKK